MTGRPVIDAGPALNFFATNSERLLIATLGPLSAPETVQNEALRKTRQEPRFRPAERVLSKLGPAWLEILSDDATPELEAVIQRITRVPMAERLTDQNDLGELMVIAHAVVTAEAGAHVTILIDEIDGARLATQQARRLDRIRQGGAECGSIVVAQTATVLAKAAGSEYVPDRNAMRSLYNRMRQLDDGLIHIDQTDLLSDNVWSRAPE